VCSKQEATQRVRQHSEDAALSGPTGCESANVTVAVDLYLFLSPAYNPKYDNVYRCISPELKDACYRSVQNVLLSSLIHKNIKIKVYRIVILPVVCVGVKLDRSN